MILKEAIKEVENSLGNTIPTLVSLKDTERRENALKLLIEAGEAFLKSRQENNPSFLALLPSETEK